MNKSNTVLALALLATIIFAGVFFYKQKTQTDLSAGAKRAKVPEVLEFIPIGQENQIAKNVRAKIKAEYGDVDELDIVPEAKNIDKKSLGIFLDNSKKIINNNGNKISAITVDIKVNGFDNPPPLNFGQIATVTWKAVSSTPVLCNLGGHYIPKAPVGSGMILADNLPMTGSQQIFVRHPQGYYQNLALYISCGFGSTSASDTVTMTVNPPITKGLAYIWDDPSYISTQLVISKSIDNTLSSWPETITNLSTNHHSVGVFFQNKLQLLFGDLIGYDASSQDGGINWSTTWPLGGFGSQYPEGVKFNGKVWVLDGAVPALGTASWVASSTDGINWTTLGTTPWGLRDSHRALAHNGLMYVFGGIDYNNSSASVYKNDVYSTLDGITWKLVTTNAGWPTRIRHFVISYDNSMWLMGGYDDKNTPLNDVWKSGDGGITWVEVTHHAPWTEAVQVIPYNGRIIVFELPTAANGMSNKIWGSTDGAHWTQISTHPNFTDTYGAMIKIPNSVVETAGCSDIKTLPVTEIRNTSATFNGCYNTTVLGPQQLPATTWFEWGTSPTALTNTTWAIYQWNYAGPIMYPTDWYVPFSPSTTYYYRVAVQTNTGTAYGSVESFTTLP